MTPKPPLSNVATLAGRELDAAVRQYVFKKPVKCLHLKTTRPNPQSSLRVCDGCGREFGSTTYAMALDEVPHYSTDHGPAFFAMVEAVRKAGWTVQINYEDTADVCLYCSRGPCERHGNSKHSYHFVEGLGDTLPLAFARAALLTTYPADTVRTTPEGG